MTNHLARLYCILFILAGIASASSTALSSEVLPPSVRSISEKRMQKLEALHQYAENHILKNEFRKAVRVYEDIILEEPDDETAYTGLAQCHMILGEFPRSREAYENALHINPKNETALRGLQKIQNPDSFNFAQERSAEIDTPDSPDNADTQETRIAPPVLTATPVITAPQKEKNDSLLLGAKKTMASYSLDVPTPVKAYTYEQLVQAALKNAGFYPGPIDGVIGKTTRQAIKEFQTAYDLAPDGKVGPKTWALLQSYLNKNSFD